MMTMVETKVLENNDFLNNDDEVDQTNVSPLWLLVYDNELVRRRHKKTFSKHLLSDSTQ